MPEIFSHVNRLALIESSGVYGIRKHADHILQIYNQRAFLLTQFKKQILPQSIFATKRFYFIYYTLQTNK